MGASYLWTLSTEIKETSAAFTLIELLVVIVIVGILASIAVPQFSAYRMRGYAAQAVSDLRNCAIAEEAYFLDNEAYLTCDGDACTELPGIQAISSGVELSIAAADVSFTGTARHAKGTGKVFLWDSEQGGL